MTEHSRDLVDEVNKLASAVRTSDAPDDVATKVCVLAAQARSLLEPHAWSGPYAVEQLAPPGDGMLVWHPGDVQQTIPYSPMLGNLNPTAGQAHLWVEDDVVRGTVTTCPIHAGPIGTVHGGLVAALLDELANLAVLASGHVGYTKTLTVSYRRPTPLGVELELWAHTAGRTGEAFLTSAEVRHDGRVTASAVGVHKAAGRRDEPVYPRSDT
jgi:acyl-coenzyme A thioesterase PaaI-like protein